jgi:hypothetical protein
MYHNHITKIPASWAEFRGEAEALSGSDSLASASDGVVGPGNGYENGQANGHINGHANGSTEIPESFLAGKAIRTVYGLVPLRYALDWPIFASYDELAGCAAWMGGRIPTFEEARSIYAYVDTLKKKEVERKLGKTVPAVNG